MTKILTQNFFFKVATVLAAVFLIMSAPKVQAAACVGTNGGAWEAAGTWTGCGVTGIPTSADTVDILNGKAVNINSAAACSSLTFGTGNNTTALTINLTNSLTVSGNVTVNGRTGNGNHTIAVGAGTFTAGSLSLVGGGAAGRVAQITISTGTVNISGNITGSSSDANIVFSGAGTLNVGGSMTGLTTFTASTGIVNFNGSTASVAGNYTYNVLKSNNTAGVTLGGASTITILTIGDVTANSIFNNGGFVITPGASSVLNLVSGTNILGSVSVGTPMPAWGTMNISAGTTVEYASGVAQVVSTTPSYKNITFSGAGAKTTAAGTLTVGGNWSTTGGTATLNTNNSNVTVTGNIIGTGAITSGSGTISLTGDWTNSGTFTKGTGTVVYNGGSTQTVGALTYNNLTINKAGGSASLGGSGTRVDGVLTLTSGNITTSSNDIYISSTGSISRTSGHIVGNLKKNIATGATSKTFEIGDTSNYTPVSLTFGNVTVAGDLTAKATTGDHPQISSSTIDSSKSINRYWTLTNSGISFNNYSTVLNFINPGDMDGGASTSNFIVGLYNAGWTYPTVGTKNSTNTETTGVTSFGDFQLGEMTASDITAPAAVSNLATTNPTNNSIDVTWTAPGDDNSTGTATTYDLRYSTSAITAGNFSSATAVTGEPTPSIAGSSESMTVTGLSPSTLYHFAIKTSDEVPNTSAISNVPTGTTTATPDTTAPAAVSDLSVSLPTTSSLTVSWTAPGDDNNTGTATTYDLRYSTSLITAGNFSSATAVTGEPSPSIAGSSESMVVSGLSSNTLYYFALKTSDEVPNTSVISNVVSGTTSTSSDITAPVVTAFSIPTTATSLTVSITTFTATDNIAVSGYLLTESASAPLASDPGWTGTVPTSYIFSTEGSKTLYAWAKDAAGNISTSLSDTVTITLPTTEVISYDEIQSTISGGIIVPNNILTSSTHITFTQQVQINFLTGSRIVFPVNSIMSAGTNVDFSQLSATSTISSTNLAIGSTNYNFGGAISFGLPSNSLTSDQQITIQIFTGSTYNGQTLPVFKKSVGSSVWSNITTCIISSGLCQFTTDAFSSFAVGTPIIASSGSYIPTVVNFSGRAYPNGKIRVYRRSLIENIVRNDYLPNFDITVNEKGDFAKSFVGLFEYDYLFTLEPFDKNGVSGGIIAFSKALSSNDRLLIENIFMPPTVVVQNKLVTTGKETKITGYAYPNSNIELKIDNILRINTVADSAGYYEALINTSRFSPKIHFVAVRQADQNGIVSDFSASKNFTVSALSYPRADFNGDNIIDIKDWSIFLFRWKANTTLRAFNDLNLDEKVDILDLSIFLKAMRGL